MNMFRSIINAQDIKSSIQYKATWKGIKNHNIIAFGLWSVVFVVDRDGGRAIARFGAHGNIKEADHS